MMDNRSSKLYTAVREATHNQWDPIGVCAYSNEMGEYDGYIPKLCELLLKDASEDEISEFLWIVETESMGLSGDKNATREFSKKLIELREQF
uniref:hypothetical protein n=1 Tax=Halomonas sp. TaxID=1486246 RepID=UPI002635C491|nr:hypothetical protein [Halomonas sp.]